MGKYDVDEIPRHPRGDNSSFMINDMVRGNRHQGRDYQDDFDYYDLMGKFSNIKWFRKFLKHIPIPPQLGEIKRYTVRDGILVLLHHDRKLMIDVFGDKTLMVRYVDENPTETTFTASEVAMMFRKMGYDVEGPIGDNEYLRINLDKSKIQENKNIMKKTLIKLTENDLHKIIKESVQRYLTESNNTSECEFYGDVELPEELGGEMLEDINFIAEYEFIPGERETYYDPGCDPSVEILDIYVGDDEGLTDEQIEYINGTYVSENWDSLEERAEEAAMDDVIDQQDRWDDRDWDD